MVRSYKGVRSPHVEEYCQCAILFAGQGEGCLPILTRRSCFRSGTSSSRVPCKNTVRSSLLQAGQTKYCSNKENFRSFHFFRGGGGLCTMYIDSQFRLRNFACFFENTNSKNCPESRIISVPSSLRSHWSFFSSVYLSSLQRVTRRVFIISRCSHKSKQKLYFRFPSQRVHTTNNCENIKKILLNFQDLKKYHLVTLSH